MRSKGLNKLFFTILSGTFIVLGSTMNAKASDNFANSMPMVPIVEIDNVLSRENQMDTADNIQLYLVKNDKGEYLNIAFSNVSDFAYIRYAASEKSDWSGKMYKGTTVEILDNQGDWVRIKSGNVYGYVQAKDLIMGKDAKEYDSDNTAQIYNYAESRVEEEARLLKEEAERKGREVIEYGSQFIGNPYVWGGTSLVNGTDCSGFVQAVYANFGISLPRTTWSMESVGTPVSYEEMLPGDIVLYNGHVGLYAGNDTILNALNERQGITISNARYAPIITIRRVL